MDRNDGFSPKEFEYFDYINEHRRNIMICLNLLSQYHNGLMTNNAGVTWREQIKTLKNRVLQHDLSKFDPIEFYEYQKAFYPDEGEKKGKLEYAWVNHYSKNSHHVEYHERFETQVTEMDIIEMALDWSAMSLKFGGCPLEYYRENKETKLKKKFGKSSLTFDFRRLEEILHGLSWAIKRHRKFEKEGKDNIFIWM